MKISITPTEQMISIHDLDRVEFPRFVRVWEGVTDSGTKCTLFIIGIAVANSENQSAFDRELREFVPRDRQVFDLRHIL